jgi:hypothetical protein
MSTAGAIAVAVASLAALAFLARQVLDLRRQRRNLKHWERDEPLEKTGDWD